jgi:hypothetical protein
MRIALSANQTQILEPVTPAESDDGQEDPDVAMKQGHIRHLDVAQEAVLSAIGFMTDAQRQKKSNEANGQGVLGIGTICGLINYHVALPMSCQRNSSMVSR